MGHEAKAECLQLLGEMEQLRGAKDIAANRLKESLEIWQTLSTADPENIDYQKKVTDLNALLGP